MRSRREQLAHRTCRFDREPPMAHDTKVDDPVADHTRPQPRDLDGFDYSASAELFMSRTRGGRSRPRYTRFDTAAEAVRFVVEEVPAAVVMGAYLLVEEARFGVDDIRRLYESA